MTTELETDQTEQTYRVILPATYIEDHLEVWPDEIPDPEVGLTKVGKTYRGDLTLAQIKEIISRAECYEGRDGFDEGTFPICDSAKRTLKHLRPIVAQATTRFKF